MKDKTGFKWRNVAKEMFNEFVNPFGYRLFDSPPESKKEINKAIIDSMIEFARFYHAKQLEVIEDIQNKKGEHSE